MFRELIIQNLIAIHTGSAFAKVKATLMLTSIVSPIPLICASLTSWTATNSTYVLFVFGAIILDHILGTIIHLFMLKDFTFKKNIIGLVIKVGLVIAVGFLFEGINHIVEGENVIKGYLVTILRLLVFMYPAGSAFVNSSIVTNGKFPPSGFLAKLTKFQENLNIGELSKNK